MPAIIRTYYYMTKPGIIYGNSITAAAGFFMAAAGDIDLVLLVATLGGIGLIMASACVFNNYIDRDIDRKMARTKKRALARGDVPGSHALAYGTILGASGFAILAAFTNALTILLGAIAMVAYVILYGYMKRRSTLGTVVGSISGALPPAAGYTAVTGHFDMGALLLFAILVVWQMPHFYAIAMYRLDDYRSADIPVLPAVKGMRTTKWYIMLYIMAFIGVLPLFAVFGYVSPLYLLIMVPLGLAWLWRGVQGFDTQDDGRWARKMFLFSLIVLMSLSVSISLGALLV